MRCCNTKNPKSFDVTSNVHCFYKMWIWFIWWLVNWHNPKFKSIKFILLLTVDNVLKTMYSEKEKKKTFFYNNFATLLLTYRLCQKINIQYYLKSLKKSKHCNYSKIMQYCNFEFILPCNHGNRAFEMNNTKI